MSTLAALNIELSANVARLQQDMARANAAITGGFSRMEQSARLASASMAGFFKGGLGIVGVTEAVAGLVDASRDVDKLKRSLEAVDGSTQAAADDMKFLGDTAKRLGLDFTSASQAYVQLAAAAKGTGLEGEKSREVFTAVSQAVAALGGSSEQAQGALLAIGQMISKGTVQAEELRGQLGERLPGAFQIAARSIGVTTEQLGAMLEKGEIVATDFLPRFAAELDKTYSGARFNGIENNLNRISNALKGFAAAAAEFLHIPQGIDNLANNIEVVGDKFNASFGSNQAAEIAKTSAAMDALRAKVGELIKTRDMAGSMGGLFGGNGNTAGIDSDIERTNQQLLQMQRHLEDLQAQSVKPAAPVLMGPNRADLEEGLAAQKASADELRRFEVERQIRAAREKRDVEQLTALYVEQLKAKKDSKLTDTDRLAQAKAMAQDDIGKAAAKLSNRQTTQAQRDLNALLAEGKTVTEQYRTPLEAVSAEQEHLSVLLKAGAIDQETFTRAMQGAALAADQMGPTLRDYQNNLNRLGAESERIKDELDPGRIFDRQVGDINQMVEQGLLTVDQARAKAAGLFEDLNSDKTAKGLGRATEAAHDFGLALSSAAGQALTNWQGFGNFLQSLGKDIAQLILKVAVLKPLEKAISSGIGGLLGGFPMANGGIMTSAGPLPLTAYANGGVANSPQFTIFGEGRRPEAFVPLPDGRSIPVTMRGDGGGNGGTVVQVIDQRSAKSPAAEVTQQDDGNGRQRIRILIRDEVKGLLGSGHLDKSMSSNYGIKRTGVSR